MKKVTIILLAGGEASRYRNSSNSPTRINHDKLLSKKGDISLLEHVCTELRPLGDIIVTTRGEKRKQQYSELLDMNDITIISEDTEKSIGPIGGIYSALKLCKKGQIKLILPADLPNIRKDILAKLITRSSHSKFFDLISVVHPNGQVENLVLISHGDILLKSSQFLIELGFYRVSSLIRLISKKRFVNSAYLFQGAEHTKTFLDLDSHECNSEIKILTPIINYSYIDFGLDTKVNQQDPSILYRYSLDSFINRPMEEQRDPLTFLLEESNIYRKKGLLSLSLHCLLDAYKIRRDLEINNQINSLMTQLEASGRDILS